MISRSLLVLTACLSLGLAAAITPSLAQTPDLPNSEPPSRVNPRSTIPGERFLDAINLTAEQEAEIAEIRQQYQTQISDHEEALDTAQEELRQMLMAQNADNSQLRAKYAEVMALRENLGNIRFESMLAIRDVLTLEQREELAELVETHWHNSFHHQRRWR